MPPTIDELSSDEPSSINTSSHSCSVCNWIERMAISMVAALLRIDITTDTSGGDESDKFSSPRKTAGPADRAPSRSSIRRAATIAHR